MNIVLFELAETKRPLHRDDARACHVLEVLRFGPGDSFDAGLIDGPRGKATIISADERGLTLSFVWGDEPPPLDPITLLVGLPRPQTARKLLEVTTALGVAALHFVRCERIEAGYAQSRLWSTDEWRRHLIAGAAQAFSTRLPDVTWEQSLAAAALPAGACRIALDNYEASVALPDASLAAPVVLALGPERGWSARDRQQLRENGFEFAHLGERVLRVETAAVAAVSVVKGRLGLFT